MFVDRKTSALLIADVQPDFLPGGALPVAGGHEIVAPVAVLLETRLFDVVVATQDFRPVTSRSRAAIPRGTRMRRFASTGTNRFFGPIIS